MEKKKILVLSVSTVILITLLGVIIALNSSNREQIITPIYNITFSDSDGSVLETQKIKEGQKIERPNDPTKENHVFIGWMYENELYDFSKEVKSNLVLVAKWEKIDDNVEFFIITFDSDGGTTIQNQIIKNGGKVEKPQNPVKNGYTFIEWALDNQTYDFNNIVENDLNLKAIWQKNENAGNNNNNNNNNNVNDEPIAEQHLVKFITNGDSADSQIYVKNGNTISKPNNPTRKGYVFLGWMLRGTYYNFDEPVTEDITLIAQWAKGEKEIYTVTFNSNGGSPVPSQQVEEGQKAIEPVPPTKEGYRFLSWRTEDGIAYSFDSVINNDITLIANWDISHEITTAPSNLYFTNLRTIEGVDKNKIYYDILPSVYVYFDEIKNATGYILYYSEQIDGTYEKIASGSSNVIIAPQQDKSGYYKVEAINGNGYSKMSDPIYGPGKVTTSVNVSSCVFTNSENYKYTVSNPNNYNYTVFLKSNKLGALYEDFGNNLSVIEQVVANYSRIMIATYEQGDNYLIYSINPIRANSCRDIK